MINKYMRRGNCFTCGEPCYGYQCRICKGTKITSKVGMLVRRRNKNNIEDYKVIMDG